MLKLENLSAHAGQFCLKNLSLEIEKGDYFVLIGNSGAGKTILLEVLTGLLPVLSGKIFLYQQDISLHSIRQRPFGLVFQDLAIFPHLTVFQNIAYPLQQKKVSKQQIRLEVEFLSGKMDIQSLLKRMPSTLSGGELQRVALARTLALKPEILLLDEPLSALDTSLRSDLKQLLFSLNKEGQTILHVTHDFEEAVSLSNKLAVIEKGEIVQWGRTEEVLQNPLNSFVAHFSGYRNFFRVQQNPEFSESVFLNNKVKIELGYKPEYPVSTAFMRSEDVLVSESQIHSSALNCFKGTICGIYPHLHGKELKIEHHGIYFYALISNKSCNSMAIAAGKEVWVSFKANAVKIG